MTERDIIEIIKNVITDEEMIITQNSSIEDLVINSLDMMIIICEIEERSNSTFNVERLKYAKNIKDLLECIN